MKKIFVALLVIFVLFPHFMIPSFSLEKSYKWIQLPVHGGVILSLAHGYEYDAYCSTSGNGLYGKKEKADWRRLGEDDLPGYIYSVYATPDAVFCGTNEFIYINTDNDRWIKVSELLSEKKIKVTYITSSQTNNDYILFAATDRGIYRSTDHGVTWNNSSASFQVYVDTLTIDPTNPQRVYASGGDSQLYYSNDFGESWKLIATDRAHGRILSLLVDRNDSKIMYAGTSSKGIFFSSDAGLTWTNQSKGLQNIHVPFLYQDAVSTLYAGTYGGLYFYDMIQNAWVQKGKDLFNENLMCGIFFPKDNTWYVGTNGDGVSILAKGQDIWARTNSQISNVHVRRFAQDTDGKTILCGTWGGGVYRSYDVGKSWTFSSNGITNPYILCLERIAPLTYLVGTYNGGIFQSKDNGLSWNKLDTQSLFTKYIYDLAVNPKDSSIILAGTDGNIYKSVDTGRNWMKLTIGSWDKPIGNVVDISFNPYNDQEIIAATSESGLYMSRTGGDEWFSVNSGIPNRNITKIKYHPFSPNEIYCATFGSGVFYSADGGNSWGSANKNLEPLIVYDIEIDPIDPENVVIATDIGVFIRKDKDQSWKEFAENSSGLSVKTVMKNNNGDFYFAGTDQKGILRTIAFPTQPVPMQPRNAERVISLRPTFQWTETTEASIPYTFHIQIRDSKAIMYEKENVSGDQFIIPNDILERYKTYYWRVRAESYAGNTPWSNEYSFTVVTRLVLTINEPLLTINDKIAEIDPGRRTTPILIQGRTFLPIRSVIEAFGGTVSWDAPTNAITIQFQENLIGLQIGNNTAHVNNQPTRIDKDNETIVPFIENGRTMLPLRFIAESLHIRIEWNPTDKTIRLEYPNL